MADPDLPAEGKAGPESCLPPDVPDGHEAFKKVKVKDHTYGPIAMFMFQAEGGVKHQFQCTAKAAGSIEDACRILRLCYAKFQEGLSKEDVKIYRDGILADLKAARPAGAASSGSKSKQASAPAADAALEKQKVAESAGAAASDDVASAAGEKETSSRGEQASASSPSKKASEADPAEETMSTMESLLPPDAPDGHEAFEKVKVTTDFTGSKFAQCYIAVAGGKKIHFQCTSKAAGSIEAACRIVRACWLKFEEGLSKEDVKIYRDGILADLKAARSGRPAPSGSKSKASPAPAADAAVEKQVPAASDDGASTASAKETSSRGEEASASSPPRIVAEAVPAQPAAAEDKKADPGSGKRKREEPKEAAAPSPKASKKEKQLPEGWQKIHKVYQSGPRAGESYTAFENDKHKSVSSLKEVIRLNARDRGEDEDAAVKEYLQNKKVKGRPPEAEEDFDPSSSGLSEAELAALPEDAPPGHEAYRQCKYAEALSQVFFKYGSDRLQVTPGRARGSWYATFRIARACYLLFDAGHKKEEVLEKRGHFYDALARVSKPESIAAKAENPGIGGKRKRQDDEPGAAEPEPAMESEPAAEPEPVMESSPTSSSSSSQESEGSDAEEESAEQKPPLPSVSKSRPMVCGKMLVRSGLRCSCCFQLMGMCSKKVEQVPLAGTPPQSPPPQTLAPQTPPQRSPEPEQELELRTPAGAPICVPVQGFGQVATLWKDNTVWVFYDDWWYEGQVMGVAGDGKLRVWTERREQEVDVFDVRLKADDQVTKRAYAPNCVVGEDVQVQFKGRWYDANILKIEGDGSLSVKAKDGEKEYEYSVNPREVRRRGLEPKQEVDVFYNGKWFEGKVVRVIGSNVRVKVNKDFYEMSVHEVHAKDKNTKPARRGGRGGQKKGWKS
eukprot:TRINITY_DN4431_c0_g1_i1.p1 TRINITY_DN4431_c0_g1~~TRINITY_DN4431_c0_g1_i1.p1  ORF type:complete len:915 (-),score=245.51 TRINITY_DN4431_c0_g1_i1:38-2737(-)